MSGANSDASSDIKAPSCDNNDLARMDTLHDHAREHAWDWFKYHAEQRISMMRFYILLLGGVAGGIGYLLHNQEHAAAATLSLFAALMSFCFIRFDKRVSDLVKLGEKSLCHEQRFLAEMTGNSAIDICERADVKYKSWPYTYSEILRLLLRSSCTLFVFSMVYSICQSHHALYLIHSHWVMR